MNTSPFQMQRDMSPLVHQFSAINGFFGGLGLAINKAHIWRKEPRTLSYMGESNGGAVPDFQLICSSADQGASICFSFFYEDALPDSFIAVSFKDKDSASATTSPAMLALEFDQCLRNLLNRISKSQHVTWPGLVRESMSAFCAEGWDDKKTLANARDSYCHLCEKEKWRYKGILRKIKSVREGMAKANAKVARELRSCDRNGINSVSKDAESASWDFAMKKSRSQRHNGLHDLIKEESELRRKAHDVEQAMVKAKFDYLRKLPLNLACQVDPTIFKFPGA